MKKYFIFLVLLCNSLFAISQTAKDGKRMAEDSMALVGYLELGNIGARDSSCKGNVFQTTDINKVVDIEIYGYLKKQGGFPNTKELNEVLDLLKQLPFQKQNGKLILLNLYEQKKNEANIAYGKDKSCSVLSAMFLTVVQQRRLSLRSY